MVSVLFFPLLPFLFMLATIGYWAASAIFLASMGKADFSLVNKTTFTNADGEVETVVEELSDRVPCDVNVRRAQSGNRENTHTYMCTVICVFRPTILRVRFATSSTTEETSEKRNTNYTI